MYVDAGDEGVTLLMKNNPNRPYELGWERLNPDSQALAEGLRRLKAQLIPVDPRIAETKWRKSYSLCGGQMEELQYRIGKCSI